MTITLTVYSRPGCHLCDEMKDVIARVTQSIGLHTTLEEVDISHHSALEALYGVEIPVLLVDGKKAAKYRVAENELRRILIARAGQAGGAGRPGESGS